MILRMAELAQTCNMVIRDSRQAEIAETQSEYEAIPSVERSPELIEDTQASPVRRSNIKLESPEFRRAYRDVAPATEDELQFLPGAPTNFPINRKYLLGGEHVTPKVNGTSRDQARTSSGAYQRSHLPITPGHRSSRKRSPSWLKIACYRSSIFR